VSLDVFLSPAAARDRQLRLELGELLEERSPALGELRRVPVDAVGQHGHARRIVTA
jgi:hypothetical protein